MCHLKSVFFLIVQINTTQGGHLPAGAGGQVHATIALDNIPAHVVQPVHADNKLGPAVRISALVGDIQGEVPYEHLVRTCGFESSPHYKEGKGTNFGRAPN